ncbi:MAG: NAD(P)-dependent oxidoreductase, partial [Solirubrobacterales bacterium]|nr:NAD(P)-dependent oxidoreductase [Solirubrobacterales bacterium]
MSAERWLITGALGCIGSWCCRQLVRDGHAVVAFDLGEDRRRLELVMSAEELGAVEFLRGDITDLEAVE